MELLHGAALPTGRGDIAQDVLHVAVSRVYWAHPEPPASLTELRREIVHLVRAVQHPT